MEQPSLDTRIALLRQYGSFSQAYSATFQSELLHFGDRDGFLAYKMVGSTAMVLSNPVAAPEHHSALIARFVEEHRDAWFCQTSREVAELLAAMGFLVNELGYETWLDLSTYNFSGQKRRNLRKAAGQMAKHGYVSRECALCSVNLDEVRRVSEAWRRTRTVRLREVAFLNRPLVLGEEPDVRRFFSFDPNGRIAAFGFFDPIYADGAVIGYSMSTRQRSDVDFMIGHALKRYAIETFQQEGRKWVSLGLSPVEGMNDKDFKHDWMIHRIFRLMYDNWAFNRFVYPFQGHAGHKRQFDGINEQTYLAFNRPPSLPRLIKMLRACKVI